MNDYKHFAQEYDRYFALVDYRAWAEYLLKTAGINSVKGKRILDLGCGTGSLLCEFGKMGALVTGVDISAEMLSVADSKMYQKKIKAVLRKGDMAEYNDNTKYDLIYCACDSLNYLNEEKLPLFWRNVSDMLESGGVFTCDIINSGCLPKAKERFFLSDSADVNFERKFDADRLVSAVTIAKNGKSLREVHTQFIYDIDKYVSGAEAVDLAFHSTCEFMSTEPPNSESDKMQLSFIKK